VRLGAWPAGLASSGRSREPLSVVTHMHGSPRATWTPNCISNESGHTRSHVLSHRKDGSRPADCNCTPPLFPWVSSHAWGWSVCSFGCPQLSITVHIMVHILFFFCFSKCYVRQKALVMNFCLYRQRRTTPISYMHHKIVFGVSFCFSFLVLNLATHPYGLLFL
jgi:hypothetical protein